MQHFEESIHIEAPIEHVWSFLVDASHINDWSPAEYSDFSGPLDRAGTTFVQRWRVLGYEMKGTWEVLEAEPPRRFRIHTDGPTDAIYLLEPEGDGTRMTIVSDWEMPGHLPGFIQNLMTKGYVTRNMRHGMETIKALTEATVTVTA
jgi:uncharacterized protein YndB with AHSA1/START domain